MRQQASRLSVVLYSPSMRARTARSTVKRTAPASGSFCMKDEPLRVLTKATSATRKHSSAQAWIVTSASFGRLPSGQPYLMSRAVTFSIAWSFVMIAPLPALCQHGLRPSRCCATGVVLPVLEGGEILAERLRDVLALGLDLCGRRPVFGLGIVRGGFQDGELGSAEQPPAAPFADDDLLGKATWEAPFGLRLVVVAGHLLEVEREIAAAAAIRVDDEREERCRRSHLAAHDAAQSGHLAERDGIEILHRREIDEDAGLTLVDLAVLEAVPVAASRHTLPVLRLQTQALVARHV